MSNILSHASSWYFSKKALPYWVVLIFDSCIIVASGVVSHCFITGTLHTLTVFWQTIFTWCCYMFFYLIGFRVMHTYSGVIRYSSFIDLLRVAVANCIGISLIFAVRHLPLVSDMILSWEIPSYGKGTGVFVPIAWTELLTSFLISTLFMWAIRVSVKYLYDIYYVSSTAKRVFIYGVKEGGIAIAKSIHSQKSNYIVDGFVSDIPEDSRHMLMGVSIYFNDDKLIQRMKERGVNTLMISPYKSDDLRNNQQFIDRLTEANIRMMMYTSQEWDGRSDLRHSFLKEVDIEDLLPRDQINVDLGAISQILTGKCVLITGAAGSIGSEIVRQVSSFRPSQLVLIDQAETPLHDIRLMMARQFGDIPCETITASICNARHMEAIFKKYRPEYLFHAAAYKHVPMMEDNPGEAVANNIEGTRIMADLAVKYSVHKFVMVSTDKAVNPTNVMGCSKRICEMYCQSLDKELKSQNPKPRTNFVTTRFGNVLGSNGSVIPLFKEQIKAGGPLTVTHPDIIRYFMLIPEACKLVLQAGTMGNGGEIYVFDMGKPVRIADLAKRMIKLSGATDVEIEYTGLREGEKLYEELLNKEENTKPSSHPKIKLATVRELDYTEVCREIDKLVEITKEGFVDMDIVRQMKVLVPEFKSKNSKYEALD